MKAGDDFIVNIVAEGRCEGTATLRASVRAVVEREGQPNIIVLGPMYIAGRAEFHSFTDEDGTRYEVIPT